nr:unnamed protein product [Callosobruchus analis]
MADDLEDDKWLYGDGETGENTGESQQNAEASEEQQTEETEKNETIAQPHTEPEDDGPPGVDDEKPEAEDNGQDTQDGMEDGEVQQNGDDSDKEDLDDDSDDDVNVVIGDIKAAAPSYTSLNIKRGGLQTAVGDRNKQIQQQQQQPGKFAVEEFDQVGTINGVPSTEYNLDSLEDKPWRKPGADITDYFNYGFNEDTWRAYCERQKRLRVSESGVGLVPANPTGLPIRGPIPITNDNSKYAGVGGGVVAASTGYVGRLKSGMMHLRRYDDVIGAQRGAMVQLKTDQPKVNTIQVMTADRREYSRKPNFPDLSMPPPGAFETFQPEYGFNPEPEPFYGGYEPVQDLQWGTEPNPNWAPSDLKTLTGPPPSSDSPMKPPHPRSPGGSRRDKDGSPSRESRAESRARSEKRDRSERDRSHRRERSRSRGRSRRKSKSRSRSPTHRSHRKKKSRRHEDSE